VVAVEDGEITFAGRVAGRTWIVLRVAPPPGTGAAGAAAPDLRVSYGDVREVRVRRGDVVARGTTLGVTGTTLYLGVRVRGGSPEPRYVDPTPLLAVAAPRAVLVGIPIH
jgi:murein DD-endopeptidase MepM/ murein hydrolase activator NlpD